ncbi:monofunctional biosynthetic peptidoglycan transglycosylase [Methylocapsa acidiphila]|uniref:monofunctional biosynthetic peptidoglycan transglycosylase n=1 Tax=Methylocapsa acidiphila TaxID=133552 RepID=UPI0006860868|nr:monofunctional biosynthetic peptidoglycan transglycosylase [Methylocapsa acidiphila]
MSSRSGRTGVVGTLAKIVLSLIVALGLCVIALIAAYRFVPPISTLMLGRWAEGEPAERIYVPLERISPALRTAVIVSEDAQFCRNDGVDWGALREVVDAADEEGPSRGASTITMQTAKNLFLWPSRSFIRKGIEIPTALLLNMAWPKRRVLEVYLNIAEWGDGVFGAEAAARRYFHKSADRLDAAEAALLATALPNPRRRDPAKPTRRHAGLAARIMARAKTAETLVECVR